MIGIAALPTRSAVVSTRGQSTVAHGIFEAVRDTIKPRVNELRRNQLSAGTTDVGSTLHSDLEAPAPVDPAP